MAESMLVGVAVPVVPVPVADRLVDLPLMGTSSVGPTVKPKWFHGEMTSIASASTENCVTDGDTEPFTLLELTL
jgi:hypothetical protein